MKIEYDIHAIHPPTEAKRCVAELVKHIEILNKELERLKKRCKK